MSLTGQEILDKLSEVLDYVHTYDGYIVARCVYHQDSRPSMFVYPDWFRCVSCGEQGKPEKLLEKVDSSYIPVRTTSSFNNPFTKWLKSRSLPEILKLAYNNLPSTYLKHRGIPSEVQYDLGLGVLEDWVTFPIINQKRKIVGAVARSISGDEAKYVVPAGQDPNLLYCTNWYRINNCNKVYLAFGIIDAIALYMVGLPSLSTLSGKKLDDTALDFLRKQIVIVPDFGETPEALKLSAKLGARGKVLLLDYPDGTKDPADLWQNYRSQLSVDEWKRLYMGDWSLVNEMV